MQNKIDLKDIQVGDIFSEESRYTVKSINPDSISFNHLESGKDVTLGNPYAQELLKTADQYVTEVEVGLEDKIWTIKQITEAELKGTLEPGHEIRVGDIRIKGIRSLWENISGGQVFTVCFNKQGKELSKKAYNEAKQKAIDSINTKVEAAKKAKKSMSDVIAQEINALIENPILSTEAGEERILRGFKIQWVSRDGRYDCVDMDIQGSYQSKIRMVNILTLKWLVYNGVKYIVKN